MKLVHEPFDLDVTFSFRASSFNGRYKIVVNVEAFDQKNIRRPNSICLEIAGDIEEI